MSLPPARDARPLPFLPPREPLLALAFLDGALAYLDAMNAYNTPLRRDILAARQQALDAVAGADDGRHVCRFPAGHDSLAERHEALRLSIRQQLIDRNRIVPSESALLDDLVAVVFDELASADVAREEAEHSRREYDDLAVRYHAMGNQMCQEAVTLATVQGERDLYHRQWKARERELDEARTDNVTLTTALTTARAERDALASALAGLLDHYRECGVYTEDDHDVRVAMDAEHRTRLRPAAEGAPLIPATDDQYEQEREQIAEWTRRAAPPGETAPRFRYVLYDVDDTLDEGIEEAGSGPAGSERSCTTLGEATAHLERAMAGQADRDIGLLYDEHRVVAIAVRHGADVRTLDALAAPRAPDAGGPNTAHAGRAAATGREIKTPRQPMPDSAGTFAAPESSNILCPKCGLRSVTVREWESNDGASDADRYDCSHCGHHWWVEGPDEETPGVTPRRTPE